MSEQEKDTLRIIPLGGLGEIGLNMAAMEYGDSIIVIDCGLMFPEDYMLGIDIVIPDVSYLRKNREKVKAFVITHGHEDHTGALPFVLREVNAPIYGTALTIGLIEEKLSEFGLLPSTTFETVRPRDRVVIGPFDIEFIRVSHSIVDGCGLAIRTPVGTVIHTGDFKMDQTPVDGEVMDYARFSEYGESGVLLLMSDSTNVEREGYTLSEREIGYNLEEIFRKCQGRIIVAAFSSNIHRVQQVIDAAEKFGRKVVLNGKSMVANVRIARTLGYLKVPEGIVADIKDIDGIPHQRVVLLTTGSQGEPMSALTRMAMDNHKQIKVAKGDTVILSSKFIPGHEKAISTMMNHLYRRGADVIYEKVSEVHVSGHASQEELKIMLNMVRPKYFMPVHGEYRHLVLHGRLALKVGIPQENIVIAEDGDVVGFSSQDGLVRGEKVDYGRVFVDGKGVGDVGEMVLKDRGHLAQDGMVLAVVVINNATGEIVYGPEIVTRGLVLEEGRPDLMENARGVVVETLNNINVEARQEQLEVKEEVRRALRRYFNKTLERRPVILPVIIEI
ncbi:MAG TPA: ribonuclease J [Deltaproteobacteria bacterium]|nr:MAG: ribonuclease J [Deltaproteobacteria bacterium GWA2_55_82]OGQ64763.1 MAG: ribonuclease J [Deltaproteobacteria bacterium RIFCSPLOWO2_02_FULL_55_12]OIJ72611.1 MAG: ribonuclease J [Deltaproteobacteria bacterium GWC2_55_46]HBG47211.1 ribonuclease J [Deltaproteobacteria bacterium]HCY11955.1 ribonuclease J [Deltaproteobacteria bacterium]